MRMPHACDTHAKVPPSFYFIFTLKAEMITSCLKAHAKPIGNEAAADPAAAPAADPAADPAAAVRSGPWQLIKLGPGAAGEMAPAGAQQWGSRQLLEWAKSRSGVLGPYIAGAEQRLQAMTAEELRSTKQRTDERTRAFVNWRDIAAG